MGIIQLFLTMDICSFKTGSFAKGYGVEGLSDVNRCVLTRAPKDYYKNIIFSKNNKLVNIEIVSDGHDTKYMDILNAFIELINGKGVTILLFGSGNDIITDEIIYFSRWIAEYNKKKICKNMLKFNINKRYDTDIKKVLALLFNISFVDRWLATNEFPHDKFPEILREDKKALFFSLMQKRQILSNASLEEADNIEEYRAELLKKVEKMRTPKKLKGIESVVCDFLIYDTELYIPCQQDDETIKEIKYPPILYLFDYKNCFFINKNVYIQEKIKGKHLRIIYNDGQISFGNKERCLEKDYFYNYRNLEENLIKAIIKAQSFTKQNKFIVYGVLCGNYYKGMEDFVPGQEILEFFAHDMKFFDDIDSTYKFIDFETSQIILSDAGFKVIPYEEKMCFEFISDMEAKSKLPDNNKSNLEYMIRCNDVIYKFKNIF